MTILSLFPLEWFSAEFLYQLVGDIGLKGYFVAPSSPFPICVNTLTFELTAATINPRSTRFEGSLSMDGIYQVLAQ